MIIFHAIHQLLSNEVISNADISTRKVDDGVFGLCCSSVKSDTLIIQSFGVMIFCLRSTGNSPVTDIFVYHWPCVQASDVRHQFRRFRYHCVMRDLSGRGYMRLLMVASEKQKEVLPRQQLHYELKCVIYVYMPLSDMI